MRKTVTIKNGQMYLLLKSCLTLIVDYVAFVSLWKKCMRKTKYFTLLLWIDVQFWCLYESIRLIICRTGDIPQ